MAVVTREAEAEPATIAGPADAEAILKLEGVTKTFQGQTVLESFDLEIGTGEFVTLLGPSGCGKSTTLNIVAGLLEPDGGRLLLRGRPAAGLAPQKRRLGMVFQSWALFPHMPVFDNVAYGLKMQGRHDKAAIRRKVGEMLDLVHLSGAETKYPSQLSGGMQQRVALARALVTGPDLLLLDEPLSNLDAALRREMQVEIKKIHEELKISTLLVTHSQEEALVMSNRIAVMRNGRVERIGPPDEIYSDPRTGFVCTFIGDANILTGRVASRDGGAVQIVLSSGATIAAPALPEWSPGQHVTVALRPEAMAVDGERPAAENALTATVTDLIFKGGTVTYEVDCDGRQMHALSLARAGQRLHARGEVVRLTFGREDVIPLADRPDGADGAVVPLRGAAAGA